MKLTVTSCEDASDSVTANGSGVTPELPSKTLASAIDTLGFGFTVIVNVCAALVSTPPLAVPPLSCAVTVTVADPVAPAADVKVSVPVADTAGWAENSAVLLLVTMKFTVCALSLDAPALIAVAHALDWAPPSTVTV